MKAVAAAARRACCEIMAATHAGMTTEEFASTVADWLATARHPRFKRPYTELVYQPMLELLAYLRENGFKTFIVSGGGVEFMRALAEKVYGIPPEQVVGSSGELKFEMGATASRCCCKLPKVDLVDDQAGQAGRHPALHRPAADPRLRQLRRRPADAPVDRRRRRPALLGLVHHTDAERE